MLTIKMLVVHLSVTVEGRISVQLHDIDNARIIISTPSKKILMVGSKDVYSDSISYNIPGGKITPHDLSVEGAAHRELFEETYDHARVYEYPVNGTLDYVRRYVAKHNHSNIIIYWYEMDCEPRHDMAIIDNRETCIYRWVPVDTIRDAMKSANRRLKDMGRLSHMARKSLVRFVSMNKN